MYNWTTGLCETVRNSPVDDVFWRCRGVAILLMRIGSTAAMKILKGARVRTWVPQNVSASEPKKRPGRLIDYRQPWIEFETVVATSSKEGGYLVIAVD
ncbi:unnamed protein product [Caenorhabditis auriculariae]|uniref:Uncharacterized protein n=1 Tax=Caenorhabditis auriculariae TaxID=2777116 RepID=A0A8S1HLP7_9PELO|nr:unnamed protein product [Caenorhabditis auriculariae]